MPYLYGRDEEMLHEWVESSKTAAGSQAYLDKYIHCVRDHRAYVELIGAERLDKAKGRREVR
jgi:hypothetical protein